MMRPLIAACVLALSLAGCSYHLGYPQAQEGKSAGDQAIAHAECREKALDMSNNVGYRVRQFAIGLTMIGGPIGQLLEREDQRDVFTECMTTKGYTVVRATD